VWLIRAPLMFYTPNTSAEWLTLLLSYLELRTSLSQQLSRTYYSGHESKVAWNDALDPLSVSKPTRQPRRPAANWMTVNLPVDRNHCEGARTKNVRCTASRKMNFKFHHRHCYSQRSDVCTAYLKRSILEFYDENEHLLLHAKAQLYGNSVMSTNRKK
jgi:hypothetical protein